MTKPASTSHDSLLHAAFERAHEEDVTPPRYLPDALTDLWYTLRDSLERVADWASEGDSIGGSVISHIADHARDVHYRHCRNQWNAAVDEYLAFLTVTTGKAA